VTHPNVLRVVRWCAKWRSGFLLVATLFLIGCPAHPLVPLTPEVRNVARADTVAIGRHRCIFLTLRDGTHALTPEQPRACEKAFLHWAARP
jgi:hypothetical protein